MSSCLRVHDCFDAKENSERGSGNVCFMDSPVLTCAPTQSYCNQCLLLFQNLFRVGRVTWIHAKQKKTKLKMNGKVEKWKAETRQRAETGGVAAVFWGSFSQTCSGSKSCTLSIPTLYSLRYRLILIYCKKCRRSEAGWLDTGKTWISWMQGSSRSNKYHFARKMHWQGAFCIGLASSAFSSKLVHCIGYN